MSRPEYPLNPTKNRLALLRAVRDGAVTWRRGWGKDPDYTEVDRLDAGWDYGPGARHCRVNSRIQELEDTGWVRLAARGTSMYAPRLWELTPTGKVVLDAFEESWVEVPDGARP